MAERDKVDLGGKPSDCEKIEPAVNAFLEELHDNPKRVDKPGYSEWISADTDKTGSLVNTLKDLSSSHILDSNLFKNAGQTALELYKEKHYVKKFDNEPPAKADSGVSHSTDVPSQFPGATALLQQSHGIANVLELQEGDRTETMRLNQEDPNPTPMLDTVSYECKSNFVTVSTGFFKDGQQKLISIGLPRLGIEIINPDDKDNSRVLRR
jgi:hypothetical protein